jgi:hypothetical protein
MEVEVDVDQRLFSVRTHVVNKRRKFRCRRTTRERALISGQRQHLQAGGMTMHYPLLDLSDFSVGVEAPVVRMSENPLRRDRRKGTSNDLECYWEIEHGVE